tara:strand:+ start:303 stop:1028 length:726 start_codon:yes stop_codon:yes gene_type:complete
MIFSNLKAKNNTKGRFFKFYNKKRKNFTYSSFKGWTCLEVLRFKINKNQIFPKLFFDHLFKEKNKKFEYNFLNLEGYINFEINRKKFKLTRKFDTLNFTSYNDFDLKALKNSTFYLIKSKNNKNNKKIKKINFLTSVEVKKRDLWGGNCISRVFETENMTIVLFKLKKNFKFHDKGHKNEQITWLIKGSMNFYRGQNLKRLNFGNGVDIGKYQPHGGIANEALGFDVFYPKRLEKRYKKKQ